MHNKLLLFLFLVLSAQIFAQLPCGPNNPGTSKCETACLSCDISTVSSRNNIVLPPGAGGVVCSDKILESPRWFAFVAGSQILAITIHPSNCTPTTTGLEAAIISGCDLNSTGTSALACSVVPPGGPATQPVALVGLNFTVGQIYYLVVDGLNSGGICDFTISVDIGSVMPPPLGAIGTLQGPSQVCPNATVTYTIPPVTGAQTYTWNAPAGAKINGGTNFSVIPAATGASVEIQFGAAGGNVCVTASNYCSPTVQTCIAVTNTPLAIVNLPDEIVCFENTPYDWPEAPFTTLVAPGTYTLVSTPYSSYVGCDSIVRQKVKLLPWNIRTLPPIFLCQGESYTINGIQYSQGGSYQEVLQSEVTGCDSTINFSIIVIPVNAVAQQPDTITCSISSVPLTGIGSTVGGNSVMYSWINSSGQIISDTLNATATAPGNYYLIVRNSGGGKTCLDTAAVTVIGALTVPQAIAGPPQVLSCAQPQVQLQGSGSTGPLFTYFWTASNGGNIVSGSTTLTPTVNAVGTYKLRVTNLSNGCTANSTTTVTAQTLPPSLSLSGGTLTCTTPIVTLQATTNSGNATFAWTGPNGFTSNLQNPMVNVAGSYVLAVTDGTTGCSTTGTATVVANNTPPGASAGSGAITCSDTSFALNGASPTSGVGFAWTGPNSFLSSLPNPVVTLAGTYNLLVSGTNGCTSTAVSTVTLNNTLPGATLSVSSSLNCNNSTVNLLSSSTTNPALLNHIWTNPNGSLDTTGTVALLVVDTAGAYIVLVGNTVNGCISRDTITVVHHENVSASVNAQQNVSCFGANNGSLSATATGGNGSYAFLWNNGAATAAIFNLDNGTFTVTVTDTENCTATITGTITEPSALSANVSATAQSSLGVNDGTATANTTGGTPVYTYLWNTGEITQTITGLEPGFYTVTVTDANGCTNVQTTTVNQFNCVIGALIQAVNVTCNGADNGSASLNISGGTAPFTLSWSNGIVGDTVINLGPGQYTVSLIDGANCPVVVNFVITEPDILLANAVATGTSNPTSNDGTATAAPSGGTGAYTYVWSNGEMSASIVNLTGAVYTVTVTDANGCTVVQALEVPTGNCNLQSDFLSIQPTCSGLSNGEATVVVNGGTGPFTYNWSSGGSQATESDLTGGSYTVTLTDTNGCEIIDTVVLTSPPALTLALDSSTPTGCPNATQGSATVEANGGTGLIFITWNNGQTGPTAINLAAGNYTATATDENGCTSTIPVSILAVDTEAPVIVASAVTVPLGSIGSVTLTAQNLGAQLTDNCGVTSTSIVPNAFQCDDLGDHAVTITIADGAGNTASETITVTIVDNSPPVPICPSSILRCFGNSVVSYAAPTATDNCLGIGGGFVLVQGLPSGSNFPAGTTTNTYSYTDGQGNVGSCSFEVTILSQLQVSVTSITNDGGGNTGAIDLSVSGSLSPYTFEWKLNGQSLPNTTEDLSGIAAGAYTVLVTDANDCTASQNITVGTSATLSPALIELVGIYPNPTSGLVSVVLPDELIGKEMYLSVFDATGRRVKEQQSSLQKQVQLDLSGLADGLYSILIRIDEGQIVRKLIVGK